MPYCLQHSCSILQPRAFSQPFTKMQTSAVDNNSNDLPKYHKGLASVGADWKNESMISTPSLDFYAIVANSIASSRTFKISSSDKSFIG